VPGSEHGESGVGITHAQRVSKGFDGATEPVTVQQPCHGLGRVLGETGYHIGQHRPCFN
jgi:hypothetical protein